MDDLHSGQNLPPKVHCPRTNNGRHHFSAVPEPVTSGPVKKRTPSAPKRRPTRLKPLPPNTAEARDEGPRLLPLTPGKDQTGLEHFLQLADVALGRKKRDRDRLP
jgi:hypothetical protein